jgi:hypothetical protein
VRGFVQEKALFWVTLWVIKYLVWIQRYARIIDGMVLFDLIFSFPFTIDLLFSTWDGGKKGSLCILETSWTKLGP